MKIPTYKRQTSFPSRAGAQQLSVQASPSAFGAPGAAQAQMGQQIMQTAAVVDQWVKKEAATERTAVQAANTVSFEQVIGQTRDDVYADEVEAWSDTSGNNVYSGPAGVSSQNQQIQTFAVKRDAVRANLVAAANNQIAGIKDKKTRQAVASALHTRIASVMPGISTVLRTRYDDYAAGQLEILIDSQVRIAADEGMGAIGQRILSDLDGMIEWWGDWGGHTRESIEKRKKDVRSDVDVYRVRGHLTEAKRNQSAEQVQAVIDDLGDREAYPNLSLTASGQLYDKAVSLYATIERQNVAAADRKDRLVDTKRKSTQLTNYEAAAARIRETRNALGRGDELEDGKTLWDEKATIEAMQTKRGLTQAQADNLIEMVDGTDVINDPIHYHNVIKDIDDAVTDADLDVIEEQINREFPLRRIGSKAQTQLSQRIAAARGKTPEDTARKKFRGRLNTVLGGSQADAFAKFSQIGGEATDERINRADALGFFEDSIDAGARPAVAYYNTIQRYLNIDQRKMVAANIIRGSRLSLEGSSVFGYNPGETISDKNIANFLTKENLQRARAALTDYAFGKKLPAQFAGRDWAATTQTEVAQIQRDDVITHKQRLSVRDLIKIERELDFLDSVIVGDIMAPEEVVPVDNPPSPEDIKAQEESDDNWADDAWNSVFGSSEPESATEGAKERGAGGGR